MQKVVVPLHAKFVKSGFNSLHGKFRGIFIHRRRFREYYSESRSICGTGEVGRSLGRNASKNIFFGRMEKKAYQKRYFGNIICFDTSFPQTQRIGFTNQDLLKNLLKK